MSLGYNLSYDYDYLNRIRKQVMDMEKANPYWEPKTESEKRQMTGRGYPPVGAERRTVGFNNYSTFNNYYKETPKAYKSSGNDGYYYFHQNELDNLNKMNMPKINYEKNDYDNANKPIKRSDVKINEGIFEMADNKFNKDQLKGYGMKDLSPQEKAMVNLIVRTGKKAKQLEGGISKESFKKALKVSAPIAKKIASTGVKIGLPLVSGVAGEALGIPAPVGAMLGKVVAKEISKKIGGFRAINPIKQNSLLKTAKPIRPKKGGKLTKAQKEKIAKGLIGTFGAVAISGATKYILPKVVKYLESQYGITPDVARELFGLARFLVGAVVEHNVGGAGSSSGECESDDEGDGVGCLSEVKGKGYKDTVLGKRDKALHDRIVKALKGQGIMKGGSIKSFSKEALKTALKVGKKGAPIVAKKGIPLIVKAVGDSLDLPQPATKLVGEVLGEIASKAISGKGKARVKKDIGEYKGGAKSSGKSRQKDRAQKVREIMKSQKLSLPQASKYIKENNISY